TANGRVGRLVANLLLRRLGLPLLVISARDAATYLTALRRADARDPWPLATMFAKSVLAGLMRLRAAQLNEGELVPLAQLVAPDERPALYKAAQRGRLHAVRRGGTLLSTQAWVDEYRASSPGPRREAQKGLR
ncbi:MAG: Fic family protein, partial [Candidatus Eremiobacteraeota bacterium]|nr:Fic family protein [Candidatus Eremiobacteraeota bacterium]